MIILANSQVGYHEGKSGSTWNNHQKYSPEVPSLEWSQNQAWCATFMSWLALKADLAKLYPCTASCDIAGKWFKDTNRWTEFPGIGFQVFFGSKSDLQHTGLVVDYDDTYIWTIEGNTNNTGSPQGDGVYKLKHRRDDAWVQGYGAPKFEEGVISPDHSLPATPKPKPTTPKVPPVAPKPSAPTHVTHVKVALNAALHSADAKAIDKSRKVVRALLVMIQKLVNRLPDA